MPLFHTNYPDCSTAGETSPEHSRRAGRAEECDTRVLNSPELHTRPATATVHPPPVETAGAGPAARRLAGHAPTPPLTLEQMRSVVASAIAQDPYVNPRGRGRGRGHAHGVPPAVPPPILGPDALRARLEAINAAEVPRPVRGRASARVAHVPLPVPLAAAVPPHALVPLPATLPPGVPLPVPPPAPQPMPPPPGPIAGPPAMPAACVINPANNGSYAARVPYIEAALQVAYARHDMGAMDKQCQFCGALHWECDRLKGTGTRPFGTCCLSGKVDLPVLQDPPEPLKSLLIGTTQRSNQFRQNIREYNSALAFTSVGAQLATPLENQPDGLRAHAAGVLGQGPWVYRVQGQLVHQTGPLRAQDGQTETYAQLIVLDSQLAHATRHRHSANGHLDDTILLDLEMMMEERNPFHEVYRTAHALLCEQERLHPGSSELRVQLVFTDRATDPQYDPRTYRAPTADEIAVIIPGGEDKAAAHRDIQLFLKDGGIRRISEMHRSYHALSYPLLFPYDEDGWQMNIEPSDHYTHEHGRVRGQNAVGEPAQPAVREQAAGESQDQKIRQMEFYGFRLHTRRNQSNALFMAGRLFQQYICDCYATVRGSRLLWHKNNQGTIRADLYQGVLDALNDQDVQRGGDLGTRVILPSTFYGSPRYMFQTFQDSMALARQFGKISFFVTMTANSRWKEVQDALLPGQRAEDRPDLIARVFAMKKAELVQKLTKDGVLGHSFAHVFTVKFQKHGLPHVHFLLFLRHDLNPLTPDEVDLAVRAYFPDPTTEPELFRIVKDHMVHGPCGERCPTAVCMVDGRCEKWYPRPFTPATAMNEDSYPVYKRPQDGRTYQHRCSGRDYTVDNRDVVLYNPYLSYKFDCHINIEACGSIQSLKYIHKYIHKGSDRVCARLFLRDEISSFIDASYFSASECVMRLYHMSLHANSPSVKRLALHLENQQTVTFRQDEDIADIVATGPKVTTLTSFFQMNADSEDARQYYYHQFPEHFVWVPRGWKPRQAGAPQIGHVYFVSPTAGKRFYLRLLLCHVKGPTSFADLRTVEGLCHPTFQAACVALGLLEDDNEWNEALEEASVTQTGHMLRNLFVSILVNCTPAQPLQLWNTHKVHITDDLQRALRRLYPDRDEPWPSEEVVFDYGLHLIQEALFHHNKTLVTFNLPLPTGDWRPAQNDPLERLQLLAEHRRFNKDDQRTRAEQNTAVSVPDLIQLNAQLIRLSE